MTTPLWQKEKNTKELLDESERGELKSQLKIQYSKNKDHGIQSCHLMKIDGETMETVTDYFGGLQNHCSW